MVLAVGREIAVYLGERAIVVGGGVAGLPAARAVSARFRQVVISDRDELTGCGMGLVRREALYPFHRNVTDRFNKPAW